MSSEIILNGGFTTIEKYKPVDLTTKSRIAKHTGISIDAVSKWQLTPIKKVGKVNYYYQGDVYKKLRDMSSGGSIKANDYYHQRTRKEKEQADKLEMENELTRENQVLVSVVEDAIIEFVTLSKNKLMGIKKRIIRVIVARSDISISAENQKKIEQGVDEEIRKALAELSGLNTENIKSRG